MGKYARISVADISSTFSLTDAPSRSTPLLFSKRRSPSRARGRGGPAPGPVPDPRGVDHLPDGLLLELRSV